MTRKSKIARLPRSVRDELNRRLDNGQPGVRLVEWLNNLSDVKEVLAQDFHGCRITAQNVSKWKRGGYQDWLAQQECSANLRDWLADAKELGEAASPEKLTEALFTVVTVRYAAAMHDCWIDTPENRKNVEFWGRMVRDVVHLRNCGLARQRFELGEQRMDLIQQRLDLDRQRLELVRQKVGNQLQDTSNRSADIAVRSKVTDQEARSLSNAGAASPSSFDVRCSPVRGKEVTRNQGEKTLAINPLQPNPTKSNNPFFIFPHTATAGHPALSTIECPHRNPLFTFHISRLTPHINIPPLQNPAFPPKNGVIS